MRVINTDLLERELRQKTDDAAALLAKTARECEAHEEKDKDGNVVTKGRPMTADERGAIQKIIDDANGIKARLAEAKGDDALAAQIEKLTTGMTRTDAAETKRAVLKSLGHQWVESPSGDFFIKKRHQGSRNWASPVSELDRTPDMRQTTLTEDPASGGGLIVPQYRPGILPLTFRPLKIRDLLAPGTTDSPTVIYMQETTFTNAAAAVAEGAAKPESALVFTQVVENVHKIAHFIPVTEEMLEDVAQIQSYIDARLTLGLALTEEDQLLNGNGTAPNLKGIMQRSGLTPGNALTAPDTAADAIFKTMMAIFNASFIMPDAHVMNPINWQTVALLKDTMGRYLAGGPFIPAPTPTLWGLPIAVTPVIAAGKCLTGAFGSQAQIYDRGGIRVEASNSHQDFFVKNLVAIRAEERLALAVYRPSAFGITTGLT
jgi:HK97 family phage major capsid protein